MFASLSSQSIFLNWQSVNKLILVLPWFFREHKRQHRRARVRRLDMPAQLFLRCLRWYLDPGPLPSPVTILANAPLTAKRTANRGYTDAIARNGIRVKPMANQYPVRWFV
jgi:hypothetical protein